MRSTARQSVPAQRLPQAFTLVEMLVVMVVIVLALSLAVPAIRAMTGSRSEQAAQNTVAAFLARTRAEAIGLQRIEGVLFYVDNATGRVNLAQVWQSVPQTGDLSGITYLDLVPDHDTLVLPNGIRAWTIKDQPPINSPLGTLTDPYPSYRYLGYNQTPYNSNMDKVLLGGVILFDGHGRLITTQYGFRFTDNITTPTVTPLQGIAFTTPATSTANWPSANTTYLRSQAGLVLFDRETFQNVQTGSATPDGNTAGQETTVDPWIDTNSAPLLVNRYNGTLIRGE